MSVSDLLTKLNTAAHKSYGWQMARYHGNNHATIPRWFTVTGDPAFSGEYSKPKQQVLGTATTDFSVVGFADDFSVTGTEYDVCAKFDMAGQKTSATCCRTAPPEDLCVCLPTVAHVTGALKQPMSCAFKVNVKGVETQYDVDLEDGDFVKLDW